MQTSCNLRGVESKGGEEGKGTPFPLCLSRFSPPLLRFQFCAWQAVKPLQSLSPKQNKKEIEMPGTFLKRKTVDARNFQIPFYIFLMQIIRRRHHLEECSFFIVLLPVIFMRQGVWQKSSESWSSIRKFFLQASISLQQKQLLTKQIRH